MIFVPSSEVDSNSGEEKSETPIATGLSPKLRRYPKPLPLPVKLILIWSFPRILLRSGLKNLGTQQWVKPLATAVGASQSLAA